MTLALAYDIDAIADAKAEIFEGVETGGAAFDLRFLTEFANNLLRGHWTYYVGMATLILFFSYFWVSVMFKPIQIADDLKKYGGYIPGVRPGEPTASRTRPSASTSARATTRA